MNNNGVVRRTSRFSFYRYRKHEGTKWYSIYTEFYEDKFESFIDEHCTVAGDQKKVLKQFVLFSSVAGLFVSGALIVGNWLQIDTEKLVASFRDDQLVDLKYDEIFFMYYYVSSYPVVYYEQNDRAARLEYLATLPKDWLMHFLYDLARRLYQMKKHERRDEHEIELTNSSPVFESEAVSTDGIEDRLVDLDFHVYGVSRSANWFCSETMFDDKDLNAHMLMRHEEHIDIMIRDLEELVLFSTAAGFFVASSLGGVTRLQLDAEDMATYVSDNDIAHLAYDEILTMAFYARKYPFLYYEKNNHAARIDCGWCSLPDDWLCDFLFEIARRLYSIKKAQFEMDVTKSSPVSGICPDSDA